MTQQTALVTGGGGFLGRYIVHKLLERQVAVRIIGRTPQPDLEQRGVHQVCASITDPGAVSSATKGCDVVFHVAAKAGVWGPWSEYFDANVTGTRNVIKACQEHGVKRLVYTSTPSVVFTGQPFEGANESLPYGCNWLCPYPQTKAMAEAEVLTANRSDGLRTVALRPHLIWGIGDNHLIPTILAAVGKGKLKIVGDGSNRVDVTHVENAADAHLLAWDALEQNTAAGKAYFLSQGTPVNLWDWINDLLQRIDRPPLTKMISARKAYAAGAVCEGIWRLLQRKEQPPMTRFVAVELSKSHWYSIDAARRDLGYTPEQNPTDKRLEELALHLKSIHA